MGNLGGGFLPVPGCLLPSMFRLTFETIPAFISKPVSAFFDNFPDMVEIITKGHTATKLIRYMGGNLKMPGVVRNGRPVW